jgi:hypothetical protein
MNNANWLASMFSSEADGNDLIKARALNTTKVTALLAPLATAVAAVVGTQVDGPLNGLNPGQKLTLWIAMFAFLAAVVIADMLVRAITTSASLKSSATLLPAGLKGYFTKNRPIQPCSVVATRSFDGQESADDGMFLITYENNDKSVAEWVESQFVSFAA